MELLGIASATRDNALLDAWHYLLRRRNSRRSIWPCEIDLGFLWQRWSAFVHAKDRDAPALDRRALEVCVFTYIAEALQSGGLYVPGSGAFDDYRTQLSPWGECGARLARCCEDVELPTSGGELVATRRPRRHRMGRAGRPGMAAMMHGTHAMARRFFIQVQLRDGDWVWFGGLVGFDRQSRPAPFGKTIFQTPGLYARVAQPRNRFE